MTDSYVTLFLNSAIATNPLAALSLFFLFMARFLPIIQHAPFFGSRVLPNPVKVAFGICMFAIYLPQLLVVTTTTLDFNPILVIYLIKELFIGLLIGNIISMPFVIAQNAGIMIDHQRGGASLMVNDPTIQNQSSPLGSLFNMVLVYMFFVIGGPWEVLDAVSLSYDLVPPDRWINDQFFANGSMSMESIVRILGQVMTMSTQLAMPALIAMLMTDSFLGIANRLAPQVQITFLGMPLKSLLGIGVIYLGWWLLVKQMLTDSQFAITKLKLLLSLLGIETVNP